MLHSEVSLCSSSLQRPHLLGRVVVLGGALLLVAVSFDSFVQLVAMAQILPAGTTAVVMLGLSG